LSNPGIILPTDPMTSDEFIEWAMRENPGRVELIDGIVVPKEDGGPTGMAGDSPLHNLVKGSVRDAFKAALRGRGCRTYVDGVSVKAADKTTYIPDVLVDCAADFDPNNPIASEPLIAVEVLSASSGYKDMVEKLDGYFRLPTLHHYLVVEAAKRRIVLHSRTETGIATSILHGGTVMLDPPGCTVDLDIFWEDIPQ
jgi:Uma2 family endonuclease